MAPDATDERTVSARELFFGAERLEPRLREDLERKFFSSIKLCNSVYKTTYRRRLDDLNALTNPLLPADRPLQIMDVAVSTGVSTWEWVESLRQAGIRHHMTAGDLVVDAYLVSVGRRLHVLVDGGGYPLQYEIFGKVLPSPTGKRNLIRYWPQLLLLRGALRTSFASLREACPREGARRVSRRGASCQYVPLINSMLSQDSDVDVIQDDVLVANPDLNQRFHVVRAANILNLCYFDEEALVGIIKNLRSRMKSGGIFIVCKTEEHGGNHGTVFRLGEAGEFDSLARLGNGSEVEALVLRMGPA